MTVEGRRPECEACCVSGSNGLGKEQADLGNRKVRVAIIGVGNCASSLVQGVEYYKHAADDEFVPGLMHVNLGGLHISDIEFSAAFDVNVTKVGKDLSEAIWAEPNNTIKFSDVPHLGVPVHRGMTHDGIGKYLSEVITKAPGQTANIVQVLKETRTDVVVSYLPVGSEMATKWYVEQVLEAGCAFVNCIPVFIAREEYWQRRFLEKGLPIIGEAIVRRYRREYEQVWFIGNGVSDRGAAQVADRVWAVEPLLAYCRQLGIPATPFETFYDVRADVESLLRRSVPASD